MCRVSETAGPKWIDSYQGLGYRAEVKTDGRSVRKTGQLKQLAMHCMGKHGIMPAGMNLFERILVQAPVYLNH
jgi:hypothetical protein